MRSVLVLLFVILIIPSPPAFCESIARSDNQVATTLDRIVARAGSEPITLREVQSLQAISPDLTYSAALDALIEQRLVLSWARSKGMTVSQEELERTEQSIMENNKFSEDRFEEVIASRGENRQTFRDNLMEQLLVNRALRITLEPRVRIEEKEIEQRYKETYPPKETITIRHILLKPDVSTGEDEVSVRKRAIRIIEEIRAGAPFETMALQHSLDLASAGEGGDLGTFREGELLPELEKLALELEPGELGGPVETAMGFHILRLDGKGITEPPPLSQVQEKIRGDLISDREAEMRAQWLKELRDTTFVEIFSDGK